MQFMDALEVVVIGAGYVGLATAAALGIAGHRVAVVERNAERLETLRAGRLPFAEPNLEDALSGVQFTADLGVVVRRSSVVMIAVGTPPTPSHGVDLSQVFGVIEELAAYLDSSSRAIVIKSTVPVGTAAEVSAALQRLAPDAVFAVSSNPEFLRQGRALRDAVFPDRIVIGADDALSLELLRRLYAPLERATCAVPAALEPHRPSQAIPVLEVSVQSAELAKYAANAFLAMKISFINEIANVCDTTATADVDQIAAVLGLDKRIGADFLRAGLGYGGSCFPKDTRALSQTASRHGYDFQLLRSVIEVNARQRIRVLQRLERRLGGFRGRAITVLGLTFKPDTDDLRESIGLEIALELLSAGATVTAHDPVAATAARLALPSQIRVTDDLEQALTGADAAVLVTEWSAYLNADWTQLSSLMRRATVLDGRNALSPQAMRAAGVEYIGIGRGAARLV